MAAVADRRLIWLFVVLATTATLNILGMLNGFWPAARDAISNSPLPMLCAAINIVALCVLLVHLVWCTRPADLRQRLGGKPTTHHV